MTRENDKKQKEKPNQRKVAFRNEAVNALVELNDDSEVTFQKALEVAKLDCKKCQLHETSHNPKHQNCRDNPFCINRLGQEKFEKLLTQEIENQNEAKKDQKRRDLNDQPAGLENSGNFCYVNSFLQVWFNVPEFRQIVYDFRPCADFVPPPAPRMDVQGVMLALQDIFFTLQTTPFNETNKTQNLVKLLRLNTEQQDSQEFGLKFFNALERCLPEHPYGKESEERLKELFTGETCSRITCKCGHKKENKETAISLQLNIEGHSTLLDALDANFGEESLDDYKCSGCNKTGDSSKQLDYIKLPPVIMIQLNRYKYSAKGRQKLKTPLAYPRQIPAKAFQRVDQTNPPPAQTYELFAVTIHEGNNAECGHYYDLIKSPFNQKWYRYNDETVEAIPKPPGTEKPTTARNEKSRKKDKEKTPTDQKACYGLLYRRKDAVLPLPLPRLPAEELICDSKHEVDALFEGQTKKKIEKSVKRMYDLTRRKDKLKTLHTKLETHIEKYEEPSEIAFLPTSLLIDMNAQEYEVAKGEKKKKKKDLEKEKQKEEDEKKKEREDDELAAAIAASEADMIEKIALQPSIPEEFAVAIAVAEAAEADVDTETIAETETETVDGNEELEGDADPDTDIPVGAEAEKREETPEAEEVEAVADISMEEELGIEQEEPMETEGNTPQDLDIVAIAMEESELPTVDAPADLKKRTRQQNGTAKYVFSQSRSPRKNAAGTNGTNGAVQKQAVSTRVAALLSSHEIPICGHGKMSIDPILYGDVKAVTRAPAIQLLKEYDFRVKFVYENGERVFPERERDREVFVFTAEDICMECIREMREEGIFNDQLEEDEKMVRKILKEEKLRCSVKCPNQPENYFYVAKFSLSNFKKAALAVRENRLARLHTKKGILYIDSITAQKSDSTYPSLKRFRGRPRKSASEVPEKMQKMDDNAITELPNESVSEEDATVEEPIEKEPTKPVVSIAAEDLKPLEKIEFNSELRCAHGGVNFSQFRHAVTPEEWSHLKLYFEDVYEVKCSEPVCEECRQQEVDAQNGSDNMRQLVREMRKRINDTLKKVEARADNEWDDEEIKYGICSVFLEKLKKLTTRQSTSPPSICQECLMCKHSLPFKGLLNEDNQKEAHVVGLTEEEWNTFLTEIRNLENAGDDQTVFVEPRVIRIENGRIAEMCEPCFEQHIKFTEEQKYMFESENIYVKLVNPSDEEEAPKVNGKARRGRAKNVYAIKMSSSSKLMDLKVQLYDKTHQMPNDQMLYRELGGEHLGTDINNKTLFDLRLAPNNNDNPLILIAQQFTPAANQTEETGDRAPERGFVDTALAH